MNLQEANLLENGCYHYNMHLKIGHVREERHRKESYVVFIPKKYSHFALALWEKKNNKMNKKWLKMADFSSLKKYFYQVLLTSSLLVDLNLQINF